MKNYKRLTHKSYIETIDKAQHDEVFNKAVLTQAWYWDNKIESDELCEREEVRKEMAKDILKSMMNKMYKLTGCGVPYHLKIFEELIKKIEKQLAEERKDEQD